MKECEFKRNNVKGGHGGGISIRTNKLVLIENCEFDNNIANNNNQQDGSQGFGGAIYIMTSISSDTGTGIECTTSVSIKGSRFSNNQGYQGFSIYIQGSSKCQSTISITNNIFTNDHGTSTPYSGGSIIACEITKVNPTDIETSIYLSLLTCRSIRKPYRRSKTDRYTSRYHHCQSKRYREQSCQQTQP